MLQAVESAVSQCCGSSPGVPHANAYTREVRSLQNNRDCRSPDGLHRLVPTLQFDPEAIPIKGAIHLTITTHLISRYLSTGLGLQVSTLPSPTHSVFPLGKPGRRP